ncbi:hemolysin family protein [Sporosalibacterium faouarense]|uniref:hemolysin family protein n=1 Tax=Sporosalibacterium faouarense TaxID=516123 RepID=UPI002434AEDA|nr:hemolysin family protein [Sporosalibacterium faouarense]
MEGEGGLLTDFLLIALLILINAFFAASEIAIVSVKRNRIDYLANTGNKKAKILMTLIKEPSRFLATIQVGITFAGFLASASAAVSISEVLSNLLDKFNIPIIQAYSSQISIVVVTILLSFITLVVGELLPKRLALDNTEKIALFTVTPIQMFSKVMKPFIFILTSSTNFLAKILGSKTDNAEEKVTEEEIRMMVHVGEETGVIKETETEMIDSIFKFDDTLVREVMTPKKDVFALNINFSKEVFLNKLMENHYSRIPVYDEDIDNIIGILYLKDLFYKTGNSEFQKEDIDGILRPAYFVPESKNIDVLFRELQLKQQHMAIIIDEYGSVAGIVTIEDLLEQIVGEIDDEFDEHILDIEEIEKDTYMLNGMTSIKHINEELDIKLPASRFDTINGLVLDILGTIPQEGSKPIVRYKNIEFKVEKVSDKRIELIRITIR